MSSIRQIIIFLGAPGSGKGTLSRMCVDKLNWKQLSTGDVCRQHVQAGTEIGKEIDFTIKSGKLVRDSVIIDMVAQWLFTQVNDVDSVILDGFPRTVVQAQSFIDMMHESFKDVSLKIYQLNVPDSEIVDRLSSRVVCSNKECQAIYSDRVLGKEEWHSKKCDVCGHSLTKRNDDAPEKIYARLENYHFHIGQLLEFYRNMGFQVVDIDADIPTEEIFQEILYCERVIQ